MGACRDIGCRVWGLCKIMREITRNIEVTYEHNGMYRV